ncbi:DUF3536 domain-containing protein [Thermodesulfobacteriota bacterium]
MSDATDRYICIHGHFYQPPRENPWLEQIELQESAHPWHDWNQRIAEECYTPNTQARILDDRNRLEDVINNYEHISFNFGPTLLHWMEEHLPGTYELILEADRKSCETRSGHGNAIAQAYHHMIMPLASERDKITQVIWGMEDFRKRFGRDPEGMWLPETAVDPETLDIMAQYGIRYTILAPRQAQRFRERSTDEWNNLESVGIDPTRAYLCRLKQGRSMVLFFYDGPVSRGIAFEGLLNDGNNFKNRLLGAFTREKDRPQLVHIATDGESYGHHHRFGEMALAYTVARLNDDPGVQLTNYGEFLENHPPTAEVEIVENSSWSCAHGVGRWSKDCGCRMEQKPGWNQQWRESLRKAMDVLRDQADDLYVKQGARLLEDPWKARNEYINVLLEHRENVSEFLARHQSRDLDAIERVRALKLLELQRNRMMMYTSCGWFWDDILGIETLQVLKYAALVMQLGAGSDPIVEQDFLAELAKCRSNQRPHQRGDEIFLHRIRSQVADLAKVAAHLTISAFFEDLPIRGGFYCYEIGVEDSARDKAGEKLLVITRMTVTSTITEESQELVVALLYLGGVDLRCSVDRFRDENSYNEFKKDLLACCYRQSTTELIRSLDRYFPGDYFSLSNLFVEERSGIVEAITQKMYEEQARLFEEFYDKNSDFAMLVFNSDARVPDTFRVSAGFVLNRRLLHELEKLADGFFPDGLESILDEAVHWKIDLDLKAAEKLIRKRMIELLGKLEQDPTETDVPEEVTEFLRLCEDLEIPIQPGEAQIVLFRIIQSMREAGKELPEQFVELARRLQVKV